MVGGGGGPGGYGDCGGYGGSGWGNLGGVDAQTIPWHGRPCSLSLTLPPLSTIVLQQEPHAPREAD